MRHFDIIFMASNYFSAQFSLLKCEKVIDVLFQLESIHQHYFLYCLYADLNLNMIQL